MEKLVTFTILLILFLPLISANDFKDCIQCNSDPALYGTAFCRDKCGTGASPTPTSNPLPEWVWGAIGMGLIIWLYNRFLK